jgi:NAD(P)-dependent dehydrogenase (short-subunit alcohol dehydrogenase family)
MSNVQGTSLDVSGKVVLVTGGTSGIGRQAAIDLAGAGAKVAVFGRRQAEGEAAVAEITKAGGTGIFIRGDVTSEADLRRAVETVVSKFGRLDVAFNNAGVEHFAPFSTYTDVEYRRVFDINVLGVILSMKVEAEAMLRTGGGSIINTSSVAGQIGMANAGIYVASKHAVDGLTRSAALEWARQGVRVNAVAPGAVQTEMADRAFGPGETEMKQMIVSMHPLGRIGQPADISGAVLWLASSASAFVTGQVIAIDGGFTAQ